MTATPARPAIRADGSHIRRARIESRHKKIKANTEQQRHGPVHLAKHTLRSS